MIDALVYLLDNIYIRFGSKLYRQNVGIPIRNYCAPLVADLFLFCYERGFMKSLTEEKQYDRLMPSIQLLDTLTIYSILIIFTLNRWFIEYILLNFNLTKLMLLIKKQHFLDLNLSIHNDTVSSKIFDKRDDFDIVNL